MRAITHALLASLIASHVVAQERRLDDAAIYSLALDAVFGRDTTDRRVITLIDSTVAPIWGMHERTLGHFRSVVGLDTTALRHFVERNARREALAESMPRTTRRLVLFVAGDTTRPPASFGTTSVTAIGYSQNGNQAVLMVENVCGGLCGNGYVLHMIREDGKWRVAVLKGTWVS